jgi:hypothetical protein
MPRFDFEKFADELLEIQRQIPFKISARGWCYQLESFGMITKAEFNTVERHINVCRAKGLVPIDFVAEEAARSFSGVEEPDEMTPEEFLGAILRGVLECEDQYIPSWWDGETYYIQMVVEKIDLKTLFEPVCQEYHIPIATSKGWSSLLQRAEYARRFKEAEEQGLVAVLLYCGDHDPDGLRISEFLRSNLMALADVEWSDGCLGYYPSALIIERFGLNYDFIEQNNLLWIDNLITGSGHDLASPRHANHYLPYVQEYLAQYGARKCEANALVVIPDIAQDLCRETIEGYLGNDAIGRFEARREAVREAINDVRESSGLTEDIMRILGQI